MIKKKIIYGCESRGDAQSPYLTRYYLLASRRKVDDKPAWELYLHVFHRSDSPEHHDHPWDFFSLILWRGYFEETLPKWVTWDSKVFARCKRVWPGMILRRPAEWRHRVELVSGKPAVTLVLRLHYRREWGFFTRRGWQEWKAYFRERGC